MKKLLSIITGLMFIITLNVNAQDDNSVSVSPRYGQSVEQLNRDKNNCYANATDQYDKKKHRTLKRTGIGAGVGAVIGGIFGAPGKGAAAGGAAGGVTGHRKSNKEERAVNDTYASCLREKGYDVQVSD